MFLVSAPESRLLVRSPQESNHETTVIVPELTQASVDYFKCLVDSGNSYDEHAVVVERESNIALMDRALIIRALNGARPTTVSFLRVSGGKVETETGLEIPSRAALAVCAIVETGRDLTDAGELFGLSVKRQGKFYICQPVE